MKTVLITNIANEFDAKLEEVFKREGYNVLSLNGLENINETIDAIKSGGWKLDYLLDTTDFSHIDDDYTIQEDLDWDVSEAIFRKNVIAPMAMLEIFLPYLDLGNGKRLFYVTSATASINETRSVTEYGYNMAKTALHQFIGLTRNKLAPLGYTLRVFDPMAGEVSPAAAAESAFTYITRPRGTDGDDKKRNDEDNLVIWDALGRQHSW